LQAVRGAGPKESPAFHGIGSYYRFEQAGNEGPRQVAGLIRFKLLFQCGYALILDQLSDTTRPNYLHGPLQKLVPPLPDALNGSEGRYGGLDTNQVMLGAVVPEEEGGCEADFGACRALGECRRPSLIYQLRTHRHQRRGARGDGICRVKMERFLPDKPSCPELPNSGCRLGTHGHFHGRSTCRRVGGAGR